MLEITRKIKDHIYNNIDDIEKQGADRMLNERIILYTEEAEEKGEEKTIQIFNAISSLISERQ